MDLFSRIGAVFLLAVVIYLWNSYVVTTIITTLNNFHKKHNAKNINREPVRFFVENESNVIKCVGYFYWIAGALIAYGIIVNGL